MGRPLNSAPKAQGLYSPKEEKDSCGVGLVVQMKRIASRGIVVDADQVPARSAQSSPTTNPPTHKPTHQFLLSRGLIATDAGTHVPPRRLRV